MPPYRTINGAKRGYKAVLMVGLTIVLTTKLWVGVYIVVSSTACMTLHRVNFEGLDLKQNQ
jgi:hypothetical protein